MQFGSDLTEIALKQLADSIESLAYMDLITTMYFSIIFLFFYFSSVTEEDVAEKSGRLSQRHIRTSTWLVGVRKTNIR